MPSLFEPIEIGRLSLRNRTMRSATAERLSDEHTGLPLPRLQEIYTELAENEIGLIVTGHVYVLRNGKAHPEMSAFDDDSQIPIWRETIAPAQERGAKVMVQINHGGSSTDETVTPMPLSPSGIASSDRSNKSQVLTDEQIVEIAQAYGATARRAAEAGFDGVQIHGAHGYLISQFLTPALNRRTDRWGGNPPGFEFLRMVIDEVRTSVGPEYPVWIKLGVAGSEDSGQTLEMGVQAAQICAESGVDAIEVSHGWKTPAWAIKAPEPQFLSMAEAVRAAVGPEYPLALVSGFRTLSIMEETLDSGVVDMVSMCRPLIVEPDILTRMHRGEAEKSICSSCRQCWPEGLMYEGIRCRNKSVLRRLEARAA